MTQIMKKLTPEETTKLKFATDILRDLASCLKDMASEPEEVELHRFRLNSDQILKYIDKIYDILNYSGDSREVYPLRSMTKAEFSAHERRKSVLEREDGRNGNGI